MTAEELAITGLENFGRYYSIYRAMVIDNNDPNKMGALKVAVPEVQGGIVIMALPFGQYGGMDSGFKMLTPEIGETVYVMFEFGNPSKPLWTYHGWGNGEIPKELDNPGTMGVVTPNGNILIFNDDKGQLDIKIQGNANIESEDGIITINKGKNHGLIQIQNLTDKLNNLVDEVNALRNTFNNHTHPGVQTGSGVTPVTLTQVTSPISQFNKADYEDNKVKH